jgi:uncharacterized protein (DUF433 family)
MSVDRVASILYPTNRYWEANRLRGTVTPVRAIVEMWRMGVPRDEIPMHLPHITLAQVFDALHYYAEHQPEINQHIQANRVPEALVHPAVQQRKFAA